MTTANGTYMFCDSDLSFAVALTCTGPSCSSILGHSSLACNQTGAGSWDCSNGVKCASAAGFTSKFSIAGTNASVSHTQNVALNGTSFVFRQDGAGDSTLSNGTSTISSGGSSTAASSTTPTGTAASTAASASASKSGSSSSRQSFSTVLLFAVLFLSVFVPHARAQVTGGSVGSAVNAIFQELDQVGDGSSLFAIGASAIAGKFNEVAVKICTAFAGQGAGSLAGLPLAYGQCEEAMVGTEMSQIGSSLGVTLRSFSGLGGVPSAALTAAEEAAVLAADAGALPELFLANSALCGLLVAVIQRAVLDPASGNLCTALESAAVSHEQTSSSSSSSSATPSSSSPTPTSGAPSSTATGSLPAGFAANKCLDCFLNSYLYSLQVVAAETCNHAPVVAASAYDLSGIFCDPGIAADPASTAFCKSLCASPCTSFAVAAIVKGLGADYVANPPQNPDQLNALCNTCSSPNQTPANYQCASMPNCLCGIGTQLCATGCPGVA